ncbi:MAG: hypothetical protein LBO20_04370 [Bifidobacteriaceae bacterium]|jgi:hypothetical protein|nr:hypothetical protein [Bifidobacteriaceae bacterium]
MTKPVHLRRLISVFAAGALGLGGALALSPAALAAPVDVEDVTLAWTVNAETGGGAYFGGCNFLSAGVAGNTGSSRTWTEADGFWKAAEGSVSIEKPTAGGGWEAPTWATKCRDANGAAVTTAPTSTTGNRVKFSGGVGEVDVDAGTAEIAWDGAFTVVFYGGMTYWSASDPVLSVAADGTAALTATGSGYAASMDDPTVWAPLTPTTITLATFTGVSLSDDGFDATPEYRGVTVSGVTQTTTGADWGSFPQAFVDFQQLTGQGSYWYSSGGAADPKKVAGPASVVWDAAAPAALDPKVAVSASTLSADGVNTVTITGSGFDPSAVTGVYPPLAGKSSGVYVAFGFFAETWKPSAGAPSASRPAALVRWAVPAESLPIVGGAENGGIVLNADGSFSLTLDVSQKLADDAAAAKGVTTGAYGIYTYPGGGASQPAFETFTPLEFVPGIPIHVSIPDDGNPPDPGEFSWRVAGSGAVTLGSASQLPDGFGASGALPNIEVTDTRPTASEWNLTGQVGDFTGAAGSFGGQYLGWTPAVAVGGAGAQAGAAVLPGASGGLGSAKTLAFAPAGHALGSATVAAALALKVPASTPAGNYTGILTITGVG